MQTLFAAFSMQHLAKAIISEAYLVVCDSSPSTKSQKFFAAAAQSTSNSASLALVCSAAFFDPSPLPLVCLAVFFFACVTHSWLKKLKFRNSKVFSLLDHYYSPQALKGEDSTTCNGMGKSSSERLTSGGAGLGFGAAGGFSLFNLQGKDVTSGIQYIDLSSVG